MFLHGEFWTREQSCLVADSHLRSCAHAHPKPHSEEVNDVQDFAGEEQELSLEAKSANSSLRQPRQPAKLHVAHA